MKKKIAVLAGMAFCVAGMLWAQTPVAPETTAQSGGKPVSVIKTSSYQKTFPGKSKYPSTMNGAVIRMTPVAPETTAQSGGQPVSVIKTSSYKKTIPGGSKFPSTANGTKVHLNPTPGRSRGITAIQGTGPMLNAVPKAK